MYVQKRGALSFFGWNHGSFESQRSRDAQLVAGVDQSHFFSTTAAYTRRAAAAAAAAAAALARVCDVEAVGAAAMILDRCACETQQASKKILPEVFCIEFEPPVERYLGLTHDQGCCRRRSSHFHPIFTRGGVLDILHGRWRMAIDPPILPRPRRSTSGFPRPGGHWLGEVYSLSCMAVIV